MKIKDTEIEVIKGDIEKLKTGCLVAVVKNGTGMLAPEAVAADIKGPWKRCTIYVPQDAASCEKSLRLACANAIRLSAALKIKSIAFANLGHASRDLSSLAVAKIMSQEVFRYLRDQKHAFKKIIFVLHQNHDFRIFHKTINSYLGYIINKLSAGPYVTVDAIIEVKGGVVLIRRSNPPFGWALPGGFVDYGESLEEAVIREAKEETGLDIKDLRQLHTYSDPSRDPRFHTITTVFSSRAKGRPKASSDAAGAKVFKMDELREIELAFDHKKVLQDYLNYKRYKYYKR